MIYFPGLKAEDMSAMALGLSHSLSRYKLKFSPDKVDTMIVQAICMFDAFLSFIFVPSCILSGFLRYPYDVLCW